MANVTLAEYHSAVLDYLTTQVDWLTCVEHYPETETELATPCAFFSVLDWDKSDNQKGNGQLTLNVNCELLVVYGFSDPDYQVKVRDASMMLSLLIDECRFGLEIRPAVLTSAEPDSFNPELDGYAVWSIRWVQPLTIGQVEISAQTFTPGTVMVGYYPDVGPDKHSDYEVVLNVPQES